MYAKNGKDHVKAAIDNVIAAFESGKALEVAAIAALPNDTPSSKWSLSNQFIMLLSATSDARGYRQWQDVGRYVRKGAHAIHILAPRIIRRKETDDKTGDEVERKILAGFLGVPVFRLEDTEGAELPSNEPAQKPPLAEVAETWGITVRYAALAHAYGAYSLRRKDITMNTHDTRVFFHELSHAAHDRLNPGVLRGGQVPEQEIVAEFAAAVLAQIYTPDYPLGFSFSYIKRYAEAKRMTAGAACLKLLNETEKVLSLILGVEHHPENMSKAA